MSKLLSERIPRHTTELWKCNRHGVFRRESVRWRWGEAQCPRCPSKLVFIGKPLEVDPEDNNDPRDLG